MKVLWVADFGLQHNIGGAQRTNDLIIQEGLRQGIEIEYFFHDSDPAILNQNYDVLVSNNLELIATNRIDVFNYIINHPYHVRYEHDSNSYLTTQARTMLFGSTKINIFLSEFHYRTFLKEYGDIFKNVEIVTSPVDTSVFYDMGNQREDKILYIGFMHPLKGTTKFFEYVMMNPSKGFAMAAWGDPNLEFMAKSLKNIEWIGKVDHSEMPNLYNKYKTMFYHPKKFEPFCRSVGEAILCGMNLDASKNIGAIHDFYANGLDGLKKLCSESPKKFWALLK